MQADVILTVFSQSADRVRAAIEEGYIAHLREPDIEALSETVAKGFGITRRKDEDTPDPTDFDGWIFQHFFWPMPEDKAEQIASTVRGVDPSPLWIGAVEMLAVLVIRSRGVGASHLFWRMTPRWETERAFDDPVPRSQLMMRGSFAWEPGR